MNRATTQLELASNARRQARSSMVRQVTQPLSKSRHAFLICALGRCSMQNSVSGSVAISRHYARKLYVSHLAAISTKPSETCQNWGQICTYNPEALGVQDHIVTRRCTCV